MNNSSDLFRVSRRDLEDSGSCEGDPSADAEDTIQDSARQKLKALQFEFIDATEPKGEAIQDEIEFRLFSGDPNTAVVRRIKIKTPELNDRPPGFVIPSRPSTCYFKNELSQQEQVAFQASAVSGEDVKARSRSHWPGCYLPWRVITTNRYGKVDVKLDAHVIAPKSIEKSNHPRIGKKARIAKRKKLEAVLEQKRTEEASIKEKEAALREKKTKKNRAQKVKRREKERAKKAAVIAA